LSRTVKWIERLIYQALSHEHHYCWHKIIDNAIEAGATVVRVYFRQTGRRGAHETDMLVYDNGKGMAPNVMEVATSFGGSMSYGNRKVLAISEWA